MKEPRDLETPQPFREREAPWKAAKPRLWLHASAPHPAAAGQRVGRIGAAAAVQAPLLPLQEATEMFAATGAVGRMELLFKGISSPFFHPFRMAEGSLGDHTLSSRSRIREKDLNMKQNI